jgi:hypothetical protein
MSSASLCISTQLLEAIAVEMRKKIVVSAPPKPKTDQVLLIIPALWVMATVLTWMN